MALADATATANATPDVAIVLPPGEGFGPDETGAIGLVARHHAVMAEGRAIVIGRAQPSPIFDGIRYRAARPGLLGGYAGSVARTLRRIAPSLIEVHNRPGLALSLAKRFPQTPVALFIHNDPQAMRGAGGERGRAKALGDLAAVVCVSDHIARGMAVTGSPAPIVLPNPVDLAAVPHGSYREPDVLFAGRAVADKGPDLFVAAWALASRRLPGWTATVIGADRFSKDSPETPFLRALRIRAAVSGVRLLGHRPHAAVLTAMSQASIAVVPSRWAEPFGLAALEAMACGVPLICSDRGGLPEVAGDAARMIDPENLPAFADAIVTLASDPLRRAAMSEAGRARAQAFGLEAIGPRLAALRAEWVAGWPRPVRAPISAANDGD